MVQNEFNRFGRINTSGIHEGLINNQEFIPKFNQVRSPRIPRESNDLAMNFHLSNRLINLYADCIQSYLDDQYVDLTDKTVKHRNF